MMIHKKMTRHIPHLGPPIWTFRKTELQKTQRNASNSKSVVNGKFWHPFFCLDVNHQNQKLVENYKQRPVITIGW